MTPQLSIHSANILRNAKCDMPSSNRGPLVMYICMYICTYILKVRGCSHMVINMHKVCANMVNVIQHQ